MLALGKMLAVFSISDSLRVQMAAGAEGRANMVFTEVTIGPLGGLRDVVRLVPELLSAHVALLLEVAGLEIPISG